MLGVQGPPGWYFGIGPLALLDIAQCQNGPKLPTLSHYREATIGTYRAATMVSPATATSVMARLEQFKAGEAPDLKLPKEVFTAFRNPATVTGYYTSWEPLVQERMCLIVRTPWYRE